MKSFKLLAGSVILLGSVALAVPGFAGERGGKGEWHRGGGFEGHGGRLERLLDLTDAQKATLKAQREAQEETRDAHQAKVAEAREALATAVDAGANDAELNALAETLGKLHAQQVLAGAKAHKAFIAVLTSEQKQKLAELKSKREERRNARDNRHNSSSSASGA